MHKRIQELLLKVAPVVGNDDNQVSLPSLHTPADIAKFADLVVLDCMQIGRSAQIDGKIVDAAIHDRLRVGTAAEAPAKVRQLTYRDVLHTRERLGHVDVILGLAMALGYPYFLWNGRVYEVRSEGYADTGLTQDDVR